MSKKIPIWKQIIAILCSGYILAVWFLPALIMMLFDVLPYVHTSSLSKRFLISLTGSIIALGTLFLSYYHKSKKNFLQLQYTKMNWFATFLGFLMFTYAGAEFSANLFGMATFALPATQYEQVVEVETVKHLGSRNKKVSLSLRSHSNAPLAYLELSKRLFDYPRIKQGDVLKLSGRKTIIGVYVTKFELYNKAQLNKSILLWDKN